MSGIKDDGVKGFWPALPPGCPCVNAAPSTSQYFRLTKTNDPMDWHLPVQRYGADRFADENDETNCRSHAYSVYSDLDAIATLRAVVKKFKDHRILRFQMSAEMGVVMPKDDFHYSWWPSDSVTPPIDGEVVG